MLIVLTSKSRFLHNHWSPEAVQRLKILGRDTHNQTASVSAAYGSSTRQRGGGFVGERSPQDCWTPNREFSKTAGRLKLFQGSKYLAKTPDTHKRPALVSAAYGSSTRQRGGGFIGGRTRGGGSLVEGHLRTARLQIAISQQPLVA